MFEETESKIVTTAIVVIILASSLLLLLSVRGGVQSELRSPYKEGYEKKDMGEKNGRMMIGEDDVMMEQRTGDAMEEDDVMMEGGSEASVSAIIDAMIADSESDATASQQDSVSIEDDEAPTFAL